MFGRGTAKQLLAIQAISAAQMGEEIGLQGRELIGSHRNIGLAPPDGVASLIILNDELVLGAAAGVLAGRDDERAILGEQAFAMAQRILDQSRGAPVFGHIRLCQIGRAQSELQSLMRISYAVFCLNNKKNKNTNTCH